MGIKRLKRFTKDATMGASIMAFDEADVVEAFWQARQRGEYFPRDRFDKYSLDEGYRVQLGLVAARSSGGDRMICF